MNGKKSILLFLTNTGASARSFLTGLSRFARGKRSWHLDLQHTVDIAESDVRRMIESGGYDGVITKEDAFDSFPAIVSNPSLPVVMFGTWREIETPAPPVFVQNDNAAIGRFGARHLMRLGRFRTFGFVPTPKPHLWTDERAVAFVDEVSASGRECCAFDWRSGKMENWLSELPKPAAVMAACDRVAVEVVQCCLRAGVAVPQQVAVLGVDNDELLCEFSKPALTSVLPRHDVTGFIAGRTLDRLMRGWSPDGVNRVLCGEVGVVERESAVPPTPATHLILSAMEYIRRNARRNIGPADVVRHLKVSPSLAMLRFREFQGETIGEAILRVRLDEAKKVLSTTGLTVRKAALLCGFSNAAHFGALFKRRFGVPPGRWRQK